MCADLCAWPGHGRFFCAHAPGLEQQVPLQVNQASAQHCGGLPQVFLPDQGHTSGQIEVITPGDRHGRSLATLQFGEGAGQTPPHGEQGSLYHPPAGKAWR